MLTVPAQFSLAGRNAVVLGGTGVLGQALVRGLRGAGASIILMGRSPEKLNSLASDVDGFALQCDASDRSDLERAGREVAARAGRIDILLSAIGGNHPSATLSPDAGFFSMDEAALRSIFDLNLFAGAILPILALGSLMDGGSIITVSSVAADLPLSRVGAYGAAKSAVGNFTRFAALELGRRTSGRVRVNALQPGFFVSNQNRALLIDAESGQPTARGRSILDHTPAGRFGDGGDLVGATIFLASDASRFVNGAVIPVDGGFTACWGV